MRIAARSIHSAMFLALHKEIQQTLVIEIDLPTIAYLQADRKALPSAGNPLQWNVHSSDLKAPSAAIRHTGVCNAHRTVS